MYTYLCFPGDSAGGAQHESKDQHTCPQIDPLYQKIKKKQKTFSRLQVMAIVQMRQERVGLPVHFSRDVNVIHEALNIERQV